MQLSTFPLFPGLPAGLPAGAPAASATVGNGEPTEKATAFGDMLTAESAATVQPAPGSASGSTSPGNAKAPNGKASPTAAIANRSVHPAKTVIGNAAAFGGLPTASASSSTGANTVIGSIGTSAAGASLEGADVVPIESVPETTAVDAAVLNDNAAQSQVIASWMAPIVAESGSGELLGLGVASESEAALGADEDTFSAASTSMGQRQTAPTAFAGPTGFGDAPGAQTGVFTPGTAATAPAPAEAPASVAGDGGIVQNDLGDATAAHPGSAQLANGTTGTEITGAAITETSSPAAYVTVPVHPTARARTAANEKLDAIASESAAVSPLPTSVSSGQLTRSAAVATQDSATEPVKDSSGTVVPKFASQVAGAVATGTEKIAAGSKEFGSGPDGRGEPAQKHSLLSADKTLKSQVQRFGTNTAQVEAPMVASAQTTRSLTAEPEAVTPSAVPLTFDALVEEAAQAVEHTGSARKAVDAAMSLLDQAGKGTQRGVNLQFSVSGVDVAVRVEMRDDQVHTTFRTDSPELRAALAQEWQTVVSTQAVDRSQKLADPVFTSSANQSSASGDSGASQQRESSARQSHWENANGFGSSIASRTSETARPTESVHVRSSRLETSRHLDAVA